MNTEQGNSRQKGLPMCPVCFSRGFRESFRVDFLTIYHCPVCKADFKWPLPKTDMVQLFSDSPREALLKPDVLHQLNEILDADGESGTGRSLLQIGCGEDAVLTDAVQRGWLCFAVEPDEEILTAAERRHGDRVIFSDSIGNMLPHEFDLIVLLDVLHRIADPYLFFFSLFSRGAIGDQTVIFVISPHAFPQTLEARPNETCGPSYSYLINYSPESFQLLLQRLHFKTIECRTNRATREIDPDDSDTQPVEKCEFFEVLSCTAKESDFKVFLHERYVPGAWSKISEYEHMPRYLFAGELIKGGKVLDFGCGCGYGSALLGESADEVLGVDNNESALEWANIRYADAKVRFDRRTDLVQGLPDGSFDAITCFEVIEHLTEEAQKEVVLKFKRLLRPGGILILSTPNPMITVNYGDNPFHLREMDETELTDLLRSAFRHFILLRQWIGPSVLITSEPLLSGCTNFYVNERAEAPTPVHPVGFVAICSDEPLMGVRPFCYFDSGIDYVASTLEKENHLDFARLRNFNQSMTILDAVEKEKYMKLDMEKAISNLAGMLREKEENLENALSSLEEQRILLTEKDRLLQEKDRQLWERRRDLETKDRLLREIFNSKVWRYIKAARHIKSGLFGPRS